MQKVSDDELLKALKQYGSVKMASVKLGLSERRIYDRRRKLELEKNIEIHCFNAPQNSVRQDADRMYKLADQRTITYEVSNATIVVASDCHYWPGAASLAHQAFVKILEQLKPTAIILNGDVFDGARVSRHDPLYANDTPTVMQEIEACQERLAEIEKASHNSKLFWLYGNHDTRLWRYIRMNAPEVSGVPGTDIFDFFPGWHRGYVLHINDNTVVKHRWHNGVHATYNNALKSGRNIVTGHLHRLCVTPWGDYNGRRYGIDTGTLADINGEQFAYLEGSPVPWASGFVVLTFGEDGQMLPPETCEVIGEHAYFRGQKVL